VGLTKVPPGPKGNFLLGNVGEFVRDPLGFATRCAREFGNVVRVRLPHVHYLLNHPGHIEYVLRTHHRDFSKDRWTHLLSSLVGQGLLVSEGDFWRRQRQMANPAFQRERIETYSPLMIDCTLRMLQGWQDGQTRDVHRDLMRLTLAIVAGALFETETDRYAHELEQATDAITAYFASIASLPGFTWLPAPSRFRFRRAVRRLDRIVYEILHQHQAGKGGRDNLLTRLLAARDEHGGRMTDRQLRDEVLTLLLAGHETTALTLSFALYLLARHPAAEAKVVAELGEVLAGRVPVAADVQRLTYTGWVVNEALRLYPPAYNIGREALADCEIGGYPVPRGTQLWIVQWVVHRDPRWYDEPEDFRPERWDNDLPRRLPRCAYFPFGDGPRLCIGQHFALVEATLVLATILQRYHLELPPGQRLVLLPSITLRPAGGIRMTVRQRR
jgi:cytochrome P450